MATKFPRDEAYRDKYHGNPRYAYGIRGAFDAGYDAGFDAGKASILAEGGELKKRECATCRDFEANILGWVEQLGGDVSATHISWELEKLIDKLAAPTESKES